MPIVRQGRAIKTDTGLERAASMLNATEDAIGALLIDFMAKTGGALILERIELVPIESQGGGIVSYAVHIEVRL